jgi:hypothetical protein
MNICEFIDECSSILRGLLGNNNAKLTNLVGSILEPSLDEPTLQIQYSKLYLEFNAACIGKRINDLLRAGDAEPSDFVNGVNRIIGYTSIYNDVLEYAIIAYELYLRSLHILDGSLCHNIMTIIVKNIYYALMMKPGIELLMRYYRILCIVDRFDDAIHLIGCSIEYVKKGLYLTTLDHKYEQLWLLRLFLLCDISDIQMNGLIELIELKHLSIYGTLLTVTYILNNNYTLNIFQQNNLIGALICRLYTYTKSITTPYADILQLSMRHYLLILKLINKYKYAASNIEKSHILSYERLFSTDILYDYITGDNKIAYKVYKQLMLIPNKKLSEYERKMIRIMSEHLYAPCGQGYLKARDEYAKMSAAYGAI